MAEQDLKRAIQEKVQREKVRLLNQARQEADNILSQAEQEALVWQKNYLTEIEGNYLLKKAQELSKINLSARRELLEAKEEKLWEVFSYVKEKIKLIRQDKSRYKTIFKNLLRESQEGFRKVSKLKLRVNPADMDIAKGLLAEFRLSAQLEAKEAIDAGLELCALEEEISILNTLESRLEKLLPQLRQEISKILFGG